MYLYNYKKTIFWNLSVKSLTHKHDKICTIQWYESKLSPWGESGSGGLKGGGGENGGAPGHGFVVPGPHNKGLFAKLKSCM